MPNCAECVNKSCFSGSEEGRPSNCPGVLHSKEEIFALYDQEAKRGEYCSALVEAEGYCVNTRVEEIMDYAYKMGYKHLGLAFCAGFSEEAKVFCKILRANGFEVDSVCCKNCSISKSEIGIRPDQYAKKDKDFEAMCNPIGQAFMLDEVGVDLAIVLGLCVGHDTLFVQNIKAPCTMLAVKDRAMGNNPMGAIYTADGYMSRQYKFIEKKYGKDAWDK